MAYLLLAEGHTYRCRDWDGLVDRLVWARRRGYGSAKARHTTALTDRPLLPSGALIAAATKLALTTE